MLTSERAAVPSPREHLGFDVGDDRRLADWPQIDDYLRSLGTRSDRIQTDEIGRTTEGNSFLLTTISSPENLKALGRFRSIQARLADPRTVQDETEAAALIAAAKTVVLVTCSIHATEVGATQMSMALAHHLATSEDEDIARVLDNVILLLVPCLNPDGLISVKRWYDDTLGTPFEGVNPPFLYHKYTGHDNNRDWFMFTQAETRLVVEHCLNAWHPQIVYDLHQTRSSGMRMILPPFVDPVGPNVDPVLQSEIAMLGSAMAAELTAQGKPGVAMNVVYDSYSPSRSYANYHAGVRILSEAASVRIATPVELARGELKSDRGEDPLRASWNHTMPWQGGRWTLRDIVEYDFAAVMACLSHAARNRDTWVRNFYSVGKRAVSHRGNPHAFIVPEEQRDPIAATEMLDVMRTAGVEVHEATGPFESNGVSYPEGTRVIMLAQPYGAFARTLLETRTYPDVRQYPDGPPRTPYDVTAHSLPVLMGVEAAEAYTPFKVDLKPLIDRRPREGKVVGAQGASIEAFLLRPESNASALAVNRLLDAGAKIARLQEQVEVDGECHPAGTYVIDARNAAADIVSSIVEGSALTFRGVASTPGVRSDDLRTPRIGVYRSHVPAPDEGWTRFVLDEYGFSYTSLVDGDVREGGLAERFDAVVLPHQRVRHLHHGQDPSRYPERYAGGLGDAGAAALRDFVEEGGTLVAWDGAARYAVRYLDLPARNSLAGVPSSDFFGPGSLLRILLDTTHPLAYGMPEEAAVMFVNGPSFDVGEGRVVGRYPESDPLLSGWLIGGERLSAGAALATVPVGRGEVVLIGFRPHFRAQARGTYKILFNALFHSTADHP